MLMIPGKTDTAAELARLIAYVRGLGAEIRLRLNAFQHHGVQGPARDWPRMTRERMDAVAGQLRGGAAAGCHAGGLALGLWPGEAVVLWHNDDNLLP
ncbi:MAG: hypothetical protein Q8Q26_04640 [Pseudorhodobacter sp.]|nr:hypothetical protein [Pseudorhodobacter sp.]